MVLFKVVFADIRYVEIGGFISNNERYAECLWVCYCFCYACVAIRDVINNL